MLIETESMMRAEKIHWSRMNKIWKWMMYFSLLFSENLTIFSSVCMKYLSKYYLSRGKIKIYWKALVMKTIEEWKTFCLCHLFIANLKDEHWNYLLEMNNKNIGAVKCCDLKEIWSHFDNFKKYKVAWEITSTFRKALGTLWVVNIDNDKLVNCYS